MCGSDGQGCCGGNDEFSVCDPGFRKVCPVVCDYSVDSTNPTCRAATTPEYLNDQTYATCADMPWCQTTYNFCNTTAETCAQVGTPAYYIPLFCAVFFKMFHCNFSLTFVFFFHLFF
jgi:hypothetical protein